MSAAEGPAWPGVFMTVGRVRSTWVSLRTFWRSPELGRGESPPSPLCTLPREKTSSRISHVSPVVAITSSLDLSISF